MTASELIEKGVVASAATVIDTARPPNPGAATPTRLFAKMYPAQPASETVENTQGGQMATGVAEEDDAHGR